MRLHHVAYVTRDIERKSKQLSDLFGFRLVGEATVDPVQRVKIQFLDMGSGELLELIEPHGEDSPILGHLKKGGGLYHMCFEVSDLEGTLKSLRESGQAFVVCEPVPAPAIDHRRVAFVVTSDRDLVEFVESKTT